MAVAVLGAMADPRVPARCALCRVLALEIGAAGGSPSAEVVQHGWLCAAAAVDNELAGHRRRPNVRNSHRSADLWIGIPSATAVSRRSGPSHLGPRALAALATAVADPTLALTPAMGPANARPASGSRQRTLTAANASIEQVNQRVAQALTVATGRSGLTTPDQWWNWWNARNEVALAGDKPIFMLAMPSSNALFRPELPQMPPIPPWPQRPQQGFPNESLPMRECLAAGTPTWTDRGPVPIKRVRVGDRVLSQDVESGCLTYKPVLTTSIRPPMD